MTSVIGLTPDNGGLDPQAERRRAKKAETVDELFAIYFAYKQGKIAPATLESFRGMYRRELEKEIGSLKAAAIRKSDVVPVLEDIAQRAPTMSNRVRELILAVFNHAVSRGLLEMHALYGLPRFGQERVGERYLTLDELRRYQNQADLLPPVERAYFVLLLLLDMRAGELSRLEWSFIDGDLLVIPSSSEDHEAAANPDYAAPCGRVQAASRRHRNEQIHVPKPRRHQAASGVLQVPSPADHEDGVRVL